MKTRRIFGIVIGGWLLYEVGTFLVAAVVWLVTR